MPLRTHECPRCTGAIEPVPIAVPRGGGSYRDLADFQATGYRCASCGLGIVTGEVVDEMMKRVSVGGGMSERDRKTTRTGCPSCLRNVDALLLSWSTTFVEVEQCPFCRTMLLDPGEFPKVFLIEHQAKG